MLLHMRNNLSFGRVGVRWARGIALMHPSAIGRTEWEPLAPRLADTGSREFGGLNSLHARPEMTARTPPERTVCRGTETTGYRCP